MLIACAFAIAAVTIAPTVFDEPDRFDEGFVASGAMMVLRGWLPIRDLFVIYGDLPGFFGPVISGKMALRRRGADEEEPIHRRADGGDPAGG